jgi:hypothetical protein
VLAVLAATRIAFRADVIESGEVPRSLRAVRTGRPFGSGLLEPAPVTRRMTHRQVSGIEVIDPDIEA